MNHWIAVGLSKYSLPVPDFQKMQDITTLVCNVLDVEIEACKRSTRIATAVMARQMSIYFIRRRTSLSSIVIGKFFGDRDHSTVLYNNKRAEELLEVDKYFKSNIKEIEYILNK